MGANGKGNSTSETTVRYAPYLEDYHKEFLNKIKESRDNAIDVSVNPYIPYANAIFSYDDAFFGAGFTLASYPSIYDMFGKFMAGLDIDSLFNEIFEDTVNGPVIDNLVSQEAIRLTDDLEQVQYPRYEAGMRDINSVMSSTYLVGKAMMEVGRTKALARYDAETRYRVLPLVTERWKAHLDWNRMVVEMYSQILKFFIIVREDTDNHHLEINAKAVLWPFNALQYETAAIGAVSGATNTSTKTAGGSEIQRAIGGAMTGAASGALVGAQIGSIGGPLGAGIGGLVGLATSLF